MDIDRKLATWFLAELFGEEPFEPERLVLWSPATADKKSINVWRAKSVDQAVDLLAKKAVDREVYFGCGLSDSTTGRGDAHGIRVVPGIWLDLDVKNDVHKKKALAPDADAALALLTLLPHAPTMIIDTGGGFHVWWLYREPWRLETTQDQESAAAVCEGWQRLFIEAIKPRGLKVDSTYDLARVLRVAGVPSHKHGGRLVSVLRQDGPRYNPSDFDDWSQTTVLERRARAFGQPVVAADLTLSPDANPPVEKIDAMRAWNLPFRKAWEGKAQHLASQSEYDLALARFAVNAEVWTDQEIVDLLIAHRRKRGGDPKLRLDYYRATLSKAKIEGARKIAETNLAERMLVHADAAEPTLEPTNGVHAPVEPDAPKAAVVNGKRASLLHDISSALGHPISRVLKFRGEPATYRLVVDGAEVELGRVRSIMDGERFREAFADATRVVLRRFARDAWDNVAQAILTAAEDVEMGAYDSPLDTLGELLRTFLLTTRMLEVSDDACYARRPFMHKGRVAIHPTPTRTWLSTNERERMEGYDFARLMRRLGATSDVVRWRKPDGASTTSRVWLLPDAFTPDPAALVYGGAAETAVDGGGGQ